MIILIFIPLFLAWGSFLNAVAYRIIIGKSIIAPRSFCPHCQHQLAWYDLIPLLSFFLLDGRCRYCNKSISLLYPFIETITVITLAALFSLVATPYWLAYFIFFTALIITIRSDLETMLISRYATLYLLPLGWLFASIGLLPICLIESVIGSLLGYFILLAIARFFLWYKGKEGMGQGDLELLAFIGSFTGPFGCWISLAIGSLLGAVCGLSYMQLFKQQSSIKIPFGPFLAAGAILFVLYQKFLFTWLLP